jgi:hypothetical protein
MAVPIPLPTGSQAPTQVVAASLRDVASIVRQAALSSPERAEMLALLSSHFDGVTPAQFTHDLGTKDWVLRVHRGDQLVGFTTVQVLEAEHGGELISVLYSGDTIMAPEAWSSPVLARGWIAMVRTLQADAPARPWYWLLLSSGFRTYRFLPVFWAQFWPRYDADTPAEMTALLARVAQARFGAQFDGAAGVVRFAQPQRLRGALAHVPDERLLDPHVDFFLRMNPDHTAGDELVCLTELSDANLTAAGRRMIRGLAL